LKHPEKFFCDFPIDQRRKRDDCALMSPIPNGDLQRRFALAAHSLPPTTFSASIGVREVIVVRIIAGLLLFCLTATGALSDGAVSFGAAGSIRAIHGLSVNQKTRELAMAQAKQECRAQATIRDITEQCIVQSVFRNRCIAIVELRT
jgi:hypothetical protein